ncbi:MAG: hypothetical protein JNL70_11015 [Saprospiraceae bacterium]|nr:hypothetical protein [Saprospiraceae bacterium]
MSLKVITYTSFDLFEEGIYQFVEKTNGLIFEVLMSWTNASKKMIISILGQSNWVHMAAQNESIRILQPMTNATSLLQSLIT